MLKSEYNVWLDLLEHSKVLLELKQRIQKTYEERKAVLSVAQKELQEMQKC